MCIISLVYIVSLILHSLCYVGRFPAKYDRFCAVYVANHLKTRNRRSGMVADADDTRQCPFVEHYDGNLHDVMANLRRLDGGIAAHQQYGPPVNLFSPKGTRKYWVKASTPVLGSVYCIRYINALIFHCSLWQVFLVLGPGQGGLSFPGQVL